MGTKSTVRPVLIVDDDESIRFLLSFTLQEHGIDTLTAANGEDALDIVASTPVAAVLLDNHLPGISGLEVVEALRSSPQTATLPVLLVTGDDHVADRVRGLGAGASDYLVKPFDLDELVARVRAQLRGQAAWTRAIDEQLRQRAAVAADLCRVPSGSTVDATAGAFCAELADLGDVAGAAIVAFRAPGVAVALATAGDTIPGVNGTIPSGMAKDLMSRACGGPWLSPVDVGMVACAPIHRGELPVGVLLLRPEIGPGSPAAGRALSAAIDYAAIASGLIGSDLLTPVHQSTSRAEIEVILELGAFGPVFQPIVALETQSIIGYEALTRFDDGMRPDIRFAEARAVGLGLHLERATMTAALAAAELLPDGRWLSINVSPDLVVDVDAFAEVIDGYRRPLVLELTEHDPVDDYAGLRSSIEQLGSELQLSVDDAGSGFASLRHVLALEPAFMKLDQSWVAGVRNDPARQALIAGLVHFSSQTGCRLIAEGIETAPDLSALHDLDVELGQGFLFGHPEPAESHRL